MSDQHIMVIDPIAETKYYDVHCPQCGSVVQADLLAFDFGHVLRKALAIKKEIIRIYGSEEDLNYFKWDFLEDAELKLYFSIRDLQEFYKIKPEESICFQFTCDDLKRHIMRLFDVDWRDKENLVETFDKTLACWYDAAQNLVDKNRIPMQDRIKLGHLFLNPLDAMQITDNEYEYKEQLDKTISILNDLRDRSASQLGGENSEIIAEFFVQIHMEKDDMGRQMAGHITITYAEDYQRKRQQETIRNKICKNCGYKFYSSAGRYQEILIGLMGSSRVGKTAYLAALIDKIEQTGGKIQIKGTDDAGFQSFKKNILEPYQKGQKIAKTPADGREMIPLFSIPLSLWGEKTYTFVFIDMPGEVWNPPDRNLQDFIRNSRRILLYVNMLWLCIAPQQITTPEIDQSELQPDYGEDAVQINMQEIMENMGNVLKDADLKPDALVMVTMSDLIGIDGEDRLFAPETNVFSEYMRERSLNLYETKRHNQKVFRYLKREAQKEVRGNRAAAVMNGSNGIKELFDKVNYFAVAAYGMTPSETSGRIAPSLIELPFLWTLCVNGCIEAVNKKQEDKREASKKRPFFSFFRKQSDSETQDTSNIVYEPVKDRKELFLENK